MNGFYFNNSIVAESRMFPGYFYVVAHLEDFGDIPIFGSGPHLRPFNGKDAIHPVDRQAGVFLSGFKGPLRLCTWAEVRAFYRQYFPTTADWYEEQELLSLNSASL